MIYKSRTLNQTLNQCLKTFPVVVLTGPRQSGKTTLLRHSLPKYRFISLENTDVRLRAQEDPLAFLQEHKPPVIIDEIQLLPELLVYIKSLVDDNRKAGQWILIGSQNFSLMRGVSESLAGRAAILTLLPFSFHELTEQNKTSSTMDDLLKLNFTNTIQYKKPLAPLMLKGFYPEIATTKKIERQIWFNSYITTYIERDVRTLANVGDLNQFQRFVRLCAARTGQILNLSEMAKELGISVPTIKRWISLLEASYQIYLLYPYYKNLGKRLVKSPKLYFMDVGMACFLMGINDQHTLTNHLHFPQLFETLIITDTLKRFYHNGLAPSLYYIKSRDGLEVDMVIDLNGKLHLFEIKSSMTITPKHANSLKQLQRELGKQIQIAATISQTKNQFIITGNISNLPWSIVLS